MLKLKSLRIFFIRASKKFTDLPRYAKRSLAVIVDSGLCVLFTWLAFYLRLEEFIKINDVSILAVIISIFLAIPIFWLSGLYRAIIRYTNSSIVLSLAVATFAYGLLYFAIIGIYGIQGIPRSIGIIQPILLFLGITLLRLLMKYFFSINNNLILLKNKKNILIYGAGNAGRQLLASLKNNLEMEVTGFLDDNRQFHGQLVSGQIVYDPQNIENLIIKKNIELVLLALPSINRNKRNQIINSLNRFNIQVKTLPSIQDILGEKISISDIKDFAIEDLLDRDQIEGDYEILSKNISSKIVLVTGAGGSIGSELCRQIAKFNPKKLLLIELNEFALYKITEELKNKSKNLDIIPLLVNIQNSSRINEIFKNFKVHTIYHAAAYKHVPLVEENICESINNNVFGTFFFAQMAIKYNVLNFVLISSDKAVRSTNIMGASKRLAEICVQSLYDYHKKNTKFAIVRFGNVLESSGSVIPKFKEQIKKGGPLTLTHPEVTRYFMTIHEAAHLVIQAGSMTSGCEVFILDMGKSIKIKDLLYKMVTLSGLKIKDEANPFGDIELKVIGLRSGEKLYEELLIGDNPQNTLHPKIKKAQDPFILYDKLKVDLENLSSLIDKNNSMEVKEKLSKLVTSYKSNSNIVDHIYIEQQKYKNNTKTSSSIGHTKLANNKNYCD
jgi:FlaA1/EpsC-like NDP-sugar epimerase